jgi:hypothetical protein
VPSAARYRACARRPRTALGLRDLPASAFPHQPVRSGPSRRLSRPSGWREVCAPPATRGHCAAWICPPPGNVRPSEDLPDAEVW